MKAKEFPVLSYEEQDAIERLIFTGHLGGGVDRDRLESLGLIGRVADGPWFYAGGPVSEFFAYTQTKGVKDGVHA